MSTPRGPERFIDGVPTAYRMLQPSEPDEGLGGQVANLIADAEFHLQDYRDQKPMLMIYGEVPGIVAIGEMRRGWFFFHVVNHRPTWLKVFYFDGAEMIPIEHPKAEGPPTLTTDNDTVASTPGKIPLNRFQWFRCYPKWPLIWGLSFLLFLWLALSHGWGWWLPSVPLLMMNWLYWIRVREHFASGDVCPAIVISVTPLVLAVGTDLRKAFDPHPAVKVVLIPSASLPKQFRVVGTRIATVALYRRSQETSSRWSDFDPRPVGAATTRLAVIEDAASRIPESLWNDFDQWRQQVPQLTLGIHYLT